MSKFDHLRYKDVLLWLQYIVDHLQDSESYRKGLAKEFLYNYYPKDVVETGSFDKNPTIEIILADFYDNALSKFPPVVDLVLLESVLLFGSRWSERPVLRALSQCIDYKKLDDPTFSKDFSGKEKVVDPEIISFMWNLSLKDRFVFCILCLSEYLTTASYLIKIGKRTSSDLTKIIGYKITSLKKYLFERFVSSKNFAEIRQNFLYKEGLLETPGVSIVNDFIDNNVIGQENFSQDSDFSKFFQNS
jgi:hypothetical protein